MAARLVTTPYGPPAAEALRAAVAEHKRDDPLRPVTVAVPTNYVGVASRRLLADASRGPITERGVGVVGITFLTLYRLAELLGAPRLAGAQRRPVSTPVIAAAVRRALAADPGLFRDVAEHPTTEQSLVAVHRELSDCAPRALDRIAAASPRAADVVRVHRVVRRTLAREWFDERDLMDAAVRAVDDGSAVLGDLGAIVGYLPQEHEPVPGETLLDFLARRTEVAVAQAALDEAADALGDGRAIGGLSAEDAYSLALERWLALGAADFEERTAATLSELGLGADLGVEMTTLSRGQATRAGLASLLLSRYDLFLLDEPTNDLDLDGLDRLERFVTGLRTAVGVVSHDREFLARTVTKIVELDLAQQQITVFGGGYTAYLAERQVARRHAREAYEEYAGRVGDLTERARTQRAWMEKGVKNAHRKAAPDNDKIGRKFRSEATEKQAAKARQTERLIERLEVVEEPRKE
jgi:energy-coupling factor transporter ATP-binding protein EcfA2